MPGQSSQRRKYRLTVKLDPEWDSDLITWLLDLPDGYRSQAVREALRAHLRADAGSDDLEGFRRVVADELDRALRGKLITGDPGQAPTDETESKYGGKLDRMLGRLGER